MNYEEIDDLVERKQDTFDHKLARVIKTRRGRPDDE